MVECPQQRSPEHAKVDQSPCYDLRFLLRERLLSVSFGCRIELEYFPSSSTSTTPASPVGGVFETSSSFFTEAQLLSGATSASPAFSVPSLSGLGATDEANGDCSAFNGLPSLLGLVELLGLLLDDAGPHSERVDPPPSQRHRKVVEHGPEPVSRPAESTQVLGLPASQESTSRAPHTFEPRSIEQKRWQPGRLNFRGHTFIYVSGSACLLTESSDPFRHSITES